MKQYIDREVLLQIKRHYTINEISKHLLDENSRLQLEIGILKSERDELNHIMNETIEKKSKIERDDYMKDILRQLNEQRKMKNEFKRQMIEWRNKYYNEKNRKGKDIGNVVD